jgi:hypothetical protein
MSNEPETWTLAGFLDHFQQVHRKMRDHSFGWILGAGASKSAGIPTGAELVDWWLREMHVRECTDDTTLGVWATEESLGIKGFTYANAAEFYPRIYERRFRHFPEEGFAYLEDVMTGSAKSYGKKGLEEANPKKKDRAGAGVFHSR